MWPDFGRRAIAYGLGLGVPLAVLSPLISGAPDSFPLSTYPMFARARGQPTLHVLVALTASGQQQRLPPAIVGSKEVLQTKVLIERSVEGGEQAMSELCAAAAQRVAAATAYGDARSVAIVQRRYDPVGYFVHGPTPLEEQRLFECAVPGAERR